MTITGSEEECKRFINSIPVEEVEVDVYDYSTTYPYEKTGTRIDKRISILQSFLPCPTELFDVTSPVREEQAELAKQMMDKYGSTDWYSWQYENWGVKWGDCHSMLEDEDVDNNGNYVVTYAFDTPWGTATQAFLKISAMFPTLRFDFFHDEEAGFFQGCEVMKNGELVFEEFFAPCEYDVEAPDYSDDEAYSAWSDKYDKWRMEQQMNIDAMVDKVDC
jgi:hypothetical protein